VATCYQLSSQLSNFRIFEFSVILGWGGAWGVRKVPLVDDTKEKFSNLNVNIVSHNKWWPMHE